MNEYFYTREIVNYGIKNPEEMGDKYNINNPERKDGEGNQIYLGKEIQSALEKSVKFFCDRESVKIVFENALTEEEKTTLDAIVLAHKNNT